MSPTPDTTPLVMMFVSLRGGREIYNIMDTAVAMGLVGRCVDRLRLVADEYQGRAIKVIGSEAMFTFDDGEEAARAACAMQRSVRDQCATMDAPAGEMGLSIGLHCGVVIKEEREVFGDAVNVAARIMTMAKRAQVLLSRQVVDTLSPKLVTKARFFDDAMVRGRLKSVELYELLWESSGITQPINPVARAQETRYTRLRLEFEGGELTVSEDKPVVWVGRSADNDITVPNILASRRHARFEFRGGRFILVDESVNGTFLRDDNGLVSDLRREERTLKGSGAVGLAMPPDTLPDLMIRYRCE